ncbi:MAG: hypothetical protein LGR52_16090 [Candidatus Thiosymbion ectosymbiont of Robbea hypermnestra]|nr:hypothetical protein [Candidatus Thiosymbion ectosymbiont of Robbea hypermnestra]
MKEQISQSKLALDAMRRASREAVARAAEKDLKIPMWKNGEITFVDVKKEPLTIESTGEMGSGLDP